MNIGDAAPEFRAIDQDGKDIALTDFRGRKVVLYFYPKDMTPGCTVQANNLNDHLAMLRKEGYEVIGVSADSAERHCKFRDKHGLTFPLIPDTEMDIIKAYGVWGKKKFMGKEYMGIIRKTFIIDEQGLIERVIDKVKTKAHADQVLNESNK